jgi:hypothetical protein
MRQVNKKVKRQKVKFNLDLLYEIEKRMLHINHPVNEVFHINS